MDIARRTISRVLACFLFAPLAFSQAKAASSDDVFRALSSATTFEQAGISPDGKEVAWVQSVSRGSGIFISNLESHKARQITASGHAENSIAWSPDSRQIAFLSDGATPGQQQ